MACYQQADQQDRAGNITKYVVVVPRTFDSIRLMVLIRFDWRIGSRRVTARSFYAASIFLNILRQFDPEKNLSPEVRACG